MHPNILRDMVILNEKYDLGCEPPNSVKFITDRSVHVEKFIKEFNWDKSCYHPDLSEEFIEKFSHRIGWVVISGWFSLSEEFIEKHKDKIHWRYLSNADKLSEEFIDEHKDRVSWSTLARCSNFSETFIMKHLNRFGVEAVLKYQSRNLSEKLITRLKRRQEHEAYNNRRRNSGWEDDSY